jgi:hypothetical protein
MEDTCNVCGKPFEYDEEAEKYINHGHKLPGYSLTV